MKFSHLQNPNPDSRKIWDRLDPGNLKFSKKIPSEFSEGINNRTAGVKII